ncbi:fibrillin-2-like isoform X1 [Scylla paramamosain]|uniref:fibrillin-2-like isoform X1 n=1 Tax=Scylla paramamosain TaxID=85552 RepID=UPI0030838168
MTPQARRSRVVAAAAAVAVVLACCVTAAAGQAEDAIDGATTTTKEDITQVIPGENETADDEVTTAPESDGNTNTEPPETSSTTTTTTTTAATTTTTTTTPATVEETKTTLAPLTPAITEEANTTTTQPTPAPTTHATQAPSANTTITTAATCGVNADLQEAECVCRLGWIRDPADPASPCICPDLCQTKNCPVEGSCRQVTCHLATCICPDNLVYRASTSSCISPCQLYGDAVCGPSSGWRCRGEDEGGSFTCQCAEGYKLLEGECLDIDECVSESGFPCVPNEQCVNSDGSYSCACQEGFLRVANGSCVNMNECLNPRLHNCDHVCHDDNPPTRYTCDCFAGHTWNNTLQRCVLDDPATSCECGPAERSVCFRALESEKEQCFARPGFTKNGTAFIDASECGEPSSERAWCWARGQCVEGVGGSKCVCAKGFTRPPHTADCVRASCPEGMLLAGSECVDPCSSVACPPPLTCRVHGDEASCMCLSRCLSLQQPESNSSVYHGSLLVHAVSQDFDISGRVVRALEDYFGLNTVEVMSVTKINSTELPDSQQINVSVEFALVVPQPNISRELPEVIKSVCRSVEGRPALCVLPGGLLLVQDSITSMDKDPCDDDPCPTGQHFTCRVKPNVTGRFVCDCAHGFYKVDIANSLGYCQDVDECEGEEQRCGDDQDCINTAGGFVCRSKLTALGPSPKTVREMAITFGVLFFITLLALIAVLCLLKKKHKTTRELVPMTTGFDNSAYK